MRKHVVSTTLDALEWASTSLITGDVAQQIGVLEGQRGKNIQVIGSATLVRFLLRALSSGVMALSYAPARNGARRHTSFRPAVSSRT